MSKDEIKSEINKVLEKLSDKALEDLLTFLKNLEETHSVPRLDKKDIEKILAENKELLEKLAK
jgi:hypothetical protein